MPKKVKMKRKDRSSSDLMPITNLPADPPAPIPSHNSFFNKVHPSVPFTIALLILLYAALNIWIYFYGTEFLKFNPFLKKAAETVSVTRQGGFGTIPEPTAKPTPPKRIIYPLATGKQEWSIMRAPGATGPSPGKVDIDTLVPKQGETQTVTLTAKNNSPMQAAATLVTDNKHMSASMTRTAGTDTDGTWTVTWTINDTYDFIYHIDFVLTSSTGNWTGTLSLR